MLLMAALLGACSTAYTACPPVVTYTQEQRNLLADELEEMIRGNLFPQTRRAIDDYVTLYAAAKACQG
jgi:hypothetical protein